ncbi:hypothetical protein MNBD_ALPHA01-1352 [hydrothermal vent metagenome]|uniref:histidine kinase n=1 Tax=hydrothermal vent metagenome TaxID=652676 RepID=A0A3B0SD46_9ZZZZ
MTVSGVIKGQGLLGNVVLYAGERIRVQKRARFDDRIRNLITLAQDGSKHSRTLLFSHISDLFLQKRPMASAAQVRMLTEILKELLDQVSLSTRQEIAATLSSMQNPPEQLIDIICEDVVEVSGPLLEKAILPDEKLIHIIRYGTEPHRIHISRRFGLSPLVRHELEKAYQQSQNSKLKYSLNELDKLAGDHIPDMDEETTANILELLRAQNIHDSYPEHGSDDDVAPVTQDTSRSDIFVPSHKVTNNQTEPEPQDTESISEKPVEKFAAEPLDYPQHSVVNSSEKKQNEKSQNGGFPIDEAANDASLPDDPGPRDSIIKMTDTSSDLVDDIWQQIEMTRQETNRQRELVRSVADWFWEVDRSGLISFISEEAAGVFGRPASSLTGEDFITLCHKADTQGDDFSDPPHDQRTKEDTFESLFEHRSSFRNKPFYIAGSNGGKTLWYISAIAIFDIHSGRFTGFRGSARSTLTEQPSSATIMDVESGKREDISEEYISAQDTMAHEEVARQKAARTAYDEEVATELLQNLSHEFRTPLNAIIGFSEMIDMETWGPVNKHYHENTKNILAAAVQLKEAVNDVLDSAKLEAGLMQIEPESFSLKSILKNCRENVADMANDHQVRLMENNNNIDVILYNDKQSVELCLTKILASTIKRANADETLMPSVLINSNAQVRIEIPILGPEIAEKDAGKMFQKIQVEPDGQHNLPQSEVKYAPKISPGFGLSVAQNLAHMIGGDISVHTTRGYITHLVLTLSNHEPAS